MFPPPFAGGGKSEQKWAFRTGLDRANPFDFDRGRRACDPKNNF